MVVVVVTSKRPFDTGCRVPPFEFRNFCFQSHDFTLALLVAPAIVVVELDLALSSSFFVSALSMSDLVDRVMSVVVSFFQVFDVSMEGGIRRTTRRVSNK
jgi:hypothetical protein